MIRVYTDDQDTYGYYDNRDYAENDVKNYIRDECAEYFYDFDADCYVTWLEQDDGSCISKNFYFEEC